MPFTTNKNLVFVDSGFSGNLLQLVKQKEVYPSWTLLKDRHFIISLSLWKIY